MAFYALFIINCILTIIIIAMKPFQQHIVYSGSKETVPSVTHKAISHRRVVNLSKPVTYLSLWTLGVAQYARSVSTHQRVANKGTTPR